MGPTIPTVIDKILEDEAENYTNIMGKSLQPNATTTTTTTPGNSNSMTSALFPL